MLIKILKQNQTQQRGLQVVVQVTNYSY